MKKFRFIPENSICFYSGKPLIYIEQSKEDNRVFECQIYSTSPILVRAFFLLRIYLMKFL